VYAVKTKFGNFNLTMVKNLFINSDKRIHLDKREIHTLVSRLRKKLDFTIESLPINFVDTKTILSINKKYLNHNNSTDIITFNYSGDLKNFDGEIFISYNDAFENAKKFNCSANSEIARLVIHGILHLLGFDDKEKKDKIIMKKLENELVSMYSMILKKEIRLYDC